ncbi:MAG: DUF6683 family protein [Armatimonadota bacterium]
MKPIFAISLLSALVFTASQTSAARAQTSPRLGEILRDAVTAPASKKNPASTRFVPAEDGHPFLDSMTAKLTLGAPQKAAFRTYASQVMTMVEEAYTANGYEKNDIGVALGALLETCYEMDQGTYKIGNGTEQDKQKTRAAVRQIQNALGSAPAFKSLSDASKQVAYESATFLLGHLVVQLQQAGSDPGKKEAVRQQARKQIETLFKLDPDGITRLASGAFTAKSAGIASAKTAPDKSAKTGSVATAGSVGTAAVSKGPLPAASLGGARILIKYRMSYYPAMTTNFDHLILFPDGTAFDDIPSKDMPQFSAGTLKSMLKPRDVGRWKQNGNQIVLSFPANTKEPQRVLLKHPKGWYDGKQLPRESSAYDIYFPVIIPTKKHLVGSWKSSSLMTMGGMGGGTPMVAAGSSGNRTFQADGSFSDAKKSFASATTASMGEAFKSGGDVSTYSNRNKAGIGRWRLDGPLLTMERDGQRSVHIAFIMPNWSKDPKSQSDMLIDGDNWKHPDK